MTSSYREVGGGSNSTNSQVRNLFLSCTHSLGLLSLFSKMITDYRSFDLKFGSDWLSSMIGQARRFEKPYPACETRTVRTGIAYANLACTTPLWLHGLEYAKLSLHEKWNNCPHPYLTQYKTTETWAISGEYLTLRFCRRDINSIRKIRKLCY